MAKVLKDIRFKEIGSWDQSLDEDLGDLLRALKRKKGFGLFFVQCTKPQGERAIETIQKRFPQKNVVKLELDRNSETLYGELLEQYQAESFDAACVVGVEQALYGYEDTKRLGGWNSQEIYTYSWKGVPPLLSHLNRQREVFEANLPIVLIFLVPNFVIDYFVQRAPDFFDWRSGFFQLSSEPEYLHTELHDLIDQNCEKHRQLSPKDRDAKILGIKDLLKSYDLDSKAQGYLLKEQGQLFQSDSYYQQALSCFDRALELQPDDCNGHAIRSLALFHLERYEESLISFDRALELQPDNLYLYSMRGSALFHLKRHEESLISFDRALELQPNDCNVYIKCGFVLFFLGRYEESLTRIDRALELQPDNYIAYLIRSGALFFLERYEESLISIDLALELQPDERNVRDMRDRVLHYLGRDKESAANDDRTIRSL